LNECPVADRYAVDLTKDFQGLVRSAAFWIPEDGDDLEPAADRTQKNPPEETSGGSLL
jgi:hypothetical protein